MAVVLQAVERLPDPGHYQLTLVIDGQSTTFLAGVSPDGPGANFETELFFLLSDKGLEERQDSAQYHADLGLLLTDFSKGKKIKLPFIFGQDRRFG